MARTRKGRRGNGEGSVLQRKDGSWMGQVTLPESNKRKTVYGKTRQEVTEKITKILAEIQSGTYIEPSRMPLSQWLETWLWEYKKKSLRPNTFTSYEQNIRVHINPELGKNTLKDLRPEKLQGFYNKKVEIVSPATVKKLHQIIHGALQQAYKNQMIPRNISELVTLPRMKKKDVKVFSKEEQQKFMDIIKGDRAELAFRLDLATGLRIGELLALRWCDIDLVNSTLKVNQSLNRIKVFDSKGNKSYNLDFGEVKTRSGNRIIPIPENIVNELKLHKVKQREKEAVETDEGMDYKLVFCTSNGTPLEPRNLMRSFYRLSMKAGIRGASFHCMRHTFATRALEAGINSKVVQEILGHSTISMTLDTYSHVMPDSKKDAAAKLNNLFERNENENPK